MSRKRVKLAIGGSQEGHLMAGLVVILAVMMILSTVVFQGWEEVRRRDDEAEMIFRAQELVRAIDRFRKDRGHPPTSLERLIEPGSRGQYFARRLYEDPLVEDGQWGLLHIGPNNQIIDPEAVAPTAAEISRSRKRLNAFQDRRRARIEEKGRGDWRRRSSLNPGQKRQIGTLPIAGVKSLCSEKPFRVYKGRTEYREWLFTYLDLTTPQVPGKKPGIKP